jgi:hypothetical protein
MHSPSGLIYIFQSNIVQHTIDTLYSVCRRKIGHELTRLD